MEPLNQARAILVAQRLELWSVICSIINLYYNSPKHRIYLAISWEPRLCQQLEHSTLFSLLLMEPLNQARAILVAEFLELGPLYVALLVFTTTLPQIVSISPFLGNQDFVSSWHILHCCLFF
jgi:hypothetical protein